MGTKLIILTSIAMALVVMAFPTNKFQPKTVWEHYCKYTLHIHPSQATEDQYDYFLDCWSGDDEYQYLYDYYEKNTQSITKINRIQNRNIRPMKKKSKYTYLTRINGMNTFLLQVNQTPITTQTQVQPSTSTYVPKTN